MNFQSRSPRLVACIGNLSLAACIGVLGICITILQLGSYSCTQRFAVVFVSFLDSKLLIVTERGGLHDAELQGKISMPTACAVTLKVQ